MNWTKLSAIAEIVSSVAILLTLVYLALQNQQIAFQTRQNTQALEASSRQGALDSAAEVLSLAISDPDIWLISVKPELTDQERVKLSAYLFLEIGEYARTSWRQFQEGALDEEGWIGVEGPVISDLSSVQGRKWWNRFGPGFEVSFRDHVNSLLEALPVKEQLEDVLAFD
jgi:hypothetical protein